ncbi:MAG: hypothetical protein WBB55_05540, partial [Anaerolineales bacterium]
MHAHRKLFSMTSRFIWLAILLVPLLGIPQVAETQALNPGGHTPELEIPGESGTQAELSAKTIDCTHPVPGQHTMLVDDSEVGLIYTYEKYNPQANVETYDNPREGKALIQVGKMGCGEDVCTSINSPAITMAQLPGSDRPVLVTAYRDKNKRLATGRTSQGVDESWWSDQDHNKGNLRYINIAAGNLDGNYTHDMYDETVIAMRDDSNAIHLVVPGSQPNQVIASYKNDKSNGRGNVHHVGVDTGDLDGDGYNNEIVTGFKDGNDHLQAMIFRMEQGNPVLKVLWFKSWTNHYRDNIAANNWKGQFPAIRALDVTTADIDGDYQDEVILAFWDHNAAHVCPYDPVNSDYKRGDIQLLVLDPQVDADGTIVSYDDRVFTSVDPSEGCPFKNVYWIEKNIYPNTLSIETADLDGNGRVEILLGYNVWGNKPGFPYRFNTVLRMFEYVGNLNPKWQRCMDDSGQPIPCLQRLQPFWYRNGTGELMDLAARDLDRDGKVEPILAFNDTDGGLNLLTFDVGDKIVKRSEKRVDPPPSYVFDWQSMEFRIAAADMDKDAIYADYVGPPDGCYIASESYVMGVIHSPPFWPTDNDEHTEGGFGMGVGTGGGSGKTTKTTKGGSSTAKAEAFFIETAYTSGFEYSTAVEQKHITQDLNGLEFKTRPPALSDPQRPPYMDAVAYYSCPLWCYDYIESEHGSTIHVCLPRPETECSNHISGLEHWYAVLSQDLQAGGLGDSWVPVGINLARARPAENKNTNWGGEASRGVDGNTDGNYDHQSVTFSNGPQAWWQVDLGLAAKTYSVQLWNRTDAAPEHLSNFYVFLSEQPFSTDDFEEILSDPEVWFYHHPDTAGRLTTIPWDEFERPVTLPGSEEEPEVPVGRYLRVQLAGSESLSLAEVQVLGVPSAVDQWSKEAPVSADKTFTTKLPDGSQQLVDGELITKWNLSLIGVDSQGSGEFKTTKGQEWEQMVETSTSTIQKVGIGAKFEIKHVGVGEEFEYEWGSEDVTSSVTTWSQDTEFSGSAEGVTSDAYSYNYAPYVWLQRANSRGGVPQEFLVVDYYVDSYSGVPPAQAPDQARVFSGSPPEAPVIESATHPDADTWYASSTASFSWSQPSGDPAVVAGYRWFLDRIPDTIPLPYRTGVESSHTYEDLSDGVWYLHVRSQGDDGQWSETAHRQIHVDVNPPDVELALDPQLPSGHNNWYNMPLEVVVGAEDGDGSGTAAVEVSTDGSTWFPYTPPWEFEPDTAGTTVWGRAADEIGNISEPISTTFKIDRTKPNSQTQPGPTPGVILAEVVTDDMGNQHPFMAGEIEDNLSGADDMDIGLNESDWTSAFRADFWEPFPGQPGIVADWFYDGVGEISRGNHFLQSRAQDQAGNLEDIYELAQMVWFPQESPDLAGSSMVAIPETVRPGEQVAFILAVRNRGFQEAWVELIDTLPPGLTPVEELLAPDVVYDPVANSLIWPARLLWPGEWHRFIFTAQVDASADGAELENQASVHAFWPNTDLLPRRQRIRFEDRE